ncbi:hypothetical protein [Reyranella sp. CPCC 100927]|uniref:hypothetical protein n=1 Tax=Reyranella sp. CPCC 100927 TaxID=2599616 RepID=UPI0011B5B985|nr:hypothetical protein [Reyranella sp. CPCC 100927]TWT13867.1 hypothetical protein FQU96_08135 [Reyranella sp. CPCC 100927]
MTMRPVQILVNRYYQTAFGEIRHVTGISASGEVSYTSIDARGEAEPVEDKQTPMQTFASEVEKEVPSPTLP